MSVYGQSQQKALTVFNACYQKAATYDSLSLYGPCIAELTAAIDHASRYHLDKERVKATITLAEVLRKTHDYDKATELLVKLDKSDDYPELHIRKLGRMAAIYSEWLHSRDSIVHYLDSALRLGQKLHFNEQTAALYNELGYTLSANNRRLGLTYLLKSAMLFRQMNDTLGYISPMINALRSYIVLKDKSHADAIVSELVPLVHNRPWHNAKTELYTLVASYRLVFYKDSAGAAHWHSMADKSIIHHLESINDIQLNAFRTLYGTQQLKARVLDMEQAAMQKEQELIYQKKRTRELVLFSLLMALLIICVIGLLIREHRLRRKLNASNSELRISNDKYQMLMVESNHRIKNNLQMVISMLQYPAHIDDKNKDLSVAFKRMADKIYTIGALHKHLSADAHDELVALDDYFAEIVLLYADIALSVPRIQMDIAPVKINSERIVYFGLILNEMIANTLEHADIKECSIDIRVEPHMKEYRFSYRDGSMHKGAAGGTGSQLIRQLVQRVEGKQFTFDAACGQYQFTFDV